MTSVLIVDDDVAALASAGAVLTAAGYAVFSASCGRRAMRQCMETPSDLLITDILMPDCDGIELITAMKEVYPDMPIIAVTECRFLGGLDLVNLASRLGASAVLDKPLETERLLATMARLLWEPGQTRRQTMA